MAAAFAACVLLFLPFVFENMGGLITLFLMLVVGCPVVMSFTYSTINLMILHVSMLVLLSVHMGKL